MLNQLTSENELRTLGCELNDFKAAWLLKRLRFFLKMGHPRPLLRLFLVFSNKQYNSYKKINVKKCNVHQVSRARI